MSKIAKLKKQAAEFEQKRQFDKALAKYRQVLEETNGELNEADVALYNRVGDLLLRQGDVADAVTHYERAVDLYADGGYFSNAIALCNKILRTAPGRSSIYYKLGRISARKGFISDAKQNFLEYADRMRKSGQLNEAFRALKEFADLCPDQDDIRIMLADQLTRDDRKEEALEQLQILYDKLLNEGRQTEAQAALVRMRTLDPGITPSASATPLSSPAIKGGLELMMPDYGDEEPYGVHAARPQAPPPNAVEAPRLTPHEGSVAVNLGGLPIIHPDVDEIESEPLDGIEYAASLDELSPSAPTPVSGLETAFYEADDDGPTSVAHLEDLVQTALDSIDEPLDELEQIETTSSELELLEEPDEETAIEIPLLYPIDPPMSVDPDTRGIESTTLPAIDSLEHEELSFDVKDSPYGIESDGGSDLYLPDDTSAPLVQESWDTDAWAGVGAPEPDGIVATPDAPEAFPDDRSAMGDDAGDDFADLQDDPDDASDAMPATPDDPVWAADDATDTGESTEDDEELAARIEKLRARLEGDSGDPELHRRLGEALIEDGQRDEGIAELEAAIWELERMGAFGQAYALANEILRVDPDAVRFHQKRVEFAFRTGERSRLVHAYLELGDSLVRSGELPKARVVYQRVIGLAPDDARARVALDTIFEPEERPPAPPEVVAAPPVVSPALPPVQAEAPSRPATPPAAEPVRPSSWQTPATSEFVDLAAWMEEDELPKSTRMVAEGIVEPADGAQADFAEMLEKFKEGVAANVDEGDFQSHYDLGVAYREMGLIDEAISEFQKALRSTDDRVKTYEALGQCFLEKGHFPVAATLLTRALADGRRGDDSLIGVLYMLGTACEALGRHAEARSYYERVYSVDIRFRDVNDRLAATAQSAQ